MNGHRAAAGYPPGGAAVPLPGYPPDSGYAHAPDHPSGAGLGPDVYPGYPDHPPVPGYHDPPGYPREAHFPAGYPPTSDCPPMPDYPAGPGYPPDPDHPAGPGYPPDPDHPAGPGYPPTPDYPASSGYPSTPDYPHVRGDRPAPGYQPGHPAGDGPDGYSTAVHPRGEYLPEAYADQPGLAGIGADSRWAPAGVPVTHEEYLDPGDLPGDGPDGFRARPAPPGTAGAGLAPEGTPAGFAPEATAGTVPATGSERTRWAMLGYLTVPFFGFLVPLVIYLTSLRGSPWARAHAAQAINVWLTVILYDLSAAIIGAILVLDSPRIALIVVLPLVVALWLTTLAFLMHAAAAASRGDTYTFPRWLCAPMVR